MFFFTRQKENESFYLCHSANYKIMHKKGLKECISAAALHVKVLSKVTKFEPNIVKIDCY